MAGLWYLLAFISTTAASEWGYLTHGPSTWKESFPGCAGRSQSPIDIPSEQAVYESGLGTFAFQGYSKVPEGAEYSLVNNGHSAQVNLKVAKADDFSISGGGLPATYIADQFHFHWGSDDTKGSEHTVDGGSYPMEMHIVHHSADYDSLSAAAKEQEGLAVLGFFFKIGEENEVFNKVVGKLSDITKIDEEVAVDPFPLLSLLPSGLDTYYRYSGSLTTPTCDESVIWTVFKEPIEISQQQLDSFRALYYPGIEEQHLVNNFRPTQELNGRTVYTSRPASYLGRSDLGSQIIQLLKSLKKW